MDQINREIEKNRLINNLRMQGFPLLIVDAFERVRREDFVLEEYKDHAYIDDALPLDGPGSTISQPSTIAFMLSLLELMPGQKVLEIGSGSGYVLALIAEIIKYGEVYGLEINNGLVNESTRRLEDYPCIRVLKKSGISGFPEKSPFDRILVSATADENTAKILIQQLKEGGILVIPIDHSILQIRIERNRIKKEEYEGFVFVPLRKKEFYY